MEATVPAHNTLQNPRVQSSFHGDLFEDVEDWLDAFERVACSFQRVARQSEIKERVFQPRGRRSHLVPERRRGPDVMA